jgi:menaquinone-specific isochorismate synthase
MSQTAPPSRYATALEQAVQLAGRSGGAESAQVLRVEIPAPTLHPLAWLAAQAEQKRGYWADRDGEREVALVGEADEIKGATAPGITEWAEAINSRLQHAVGEVRYYGGFRFGPWHATDQAWRPFGAYRFILPRMEVCRSRVGGTTLALNLVRDAGGKLAGGVRSVVDGRPGPLYAARVAPGAGSAR